MKALIKRTSQRYQRIYNPETRSTWERHRTKIIKTKNIT